MSCSKNPILPLNYFIPDVEARNFNNRLYLYGSFDIMDNTDFYCSKKQHVFSTDDGINFVDHGICFSIEDVSWSNELLFAPDCICKNNRYYMYFCTSDRTIGVATSDNPEGPFKDAKRLNVYGIDPAVFIDDDGQGYLYWGQGNDVKAAKLSENMLDILPETIMQPLSVEEHFFHEGSSIRKHNGIYYYIFADESRNNTPTCLGYATSNSPLGKFTYQGVIIDNINCDPNTWNNHGSIAKFNGDWYIFYHRSTGKSVQSRRVCVEKINFTKDGLIPEVKMSSAGFGNKMSIFNENIISYASCLSSNIAYIRDNEIELLEILGDGQIIFNKIDLSTVKSITINFIADGKADLTINKAIYIVNQKIESIEIPLCSDENILTIQIDNFVGEKLLLKSIVLNKITSTEPI